MDRLEKAAKRLKDSGRPQKVLQVPQKDMARAAKAMQNVGIGGTVKNMGVPKDVLYRRRKIDSNLKLKAKDDSNQQ